MEEYADYTEYNLTEIFNDIEALESIQDEEETKTDLEEYRKLLSKLFKTARFIH
jgi:hypothetical protein